MSCLWAPFCKCTVRSRARTAIDPTDVLINGRSLRVELLERLHGRVTLHRSIQRLGGMHG